MTDTLNKQLPRVVIAGRPNVGKSTLFNRLCGRRRAITDPQPGVTRDALEERCSIAGIPVILTDTGGVKAEYEDDFDDIVADRSLDSLKEADVILFLTELGKVTAEDQMIVEKLRDKTEKTLLVVNKADIPEKDYQAAEFYSLGLGDPVPVSSAHGRNMDLLVEAVREKLEDFSGSAESERPEELTVALAGRPNAGKSTLANRLSGQNQSLVSDIPGTTRDTVVTKTAHKGQQLRIIDTAGIRRKAKVTENVEYYSVNRAIRAMFEADLTVLLIDAEQGLSDQDKKITAQAVKKGRTVIMALNKWDKPDPDRLKKETERIRFRFPILDWAPLIPVSALNGNGVSQLLDTILKANRQQNRRVDTPELNRALAEWVDLTPPPTHKGRPFKIRYATQIGTKPARFVAFVNRKTGFPDSYRRFLINQIRREFGFGLVPVELVLRESRR